MARARHCRVPAATGTLVHLCREGAVPDFCSRTQLRFLFCLYRHNLPELPLAGRTSQLGVGRYAAVRELSRHHSDADIYFEDDSLRIYHIQQQTAMNAKAEAPQSGREK